METCFYRVHMDVSILECSVRCTNVSGDVWNCRILRLFGRLQ